MKLEYQNTDLEKNSMIHLLEIGQGTLESDEKFLKYRNRAYLFLLVCRGSLKFTYFDEEFTLTEKKGIFLGMHGKYEICEEEGPAEILWVFFYGSNLKSIYNDFIEKNRGVCFSVKTCDDYLVIAQDIIRTVVSAKANKGLKIYEQLLKLLIQLSSEESDTKTCSLNLRCSNDAIRLDGITDYLDEHYMERIRLDELAARFFVDKYYMTKIFRDRYQMTIFQYLKNVRMSHARMLLAYSNLPIGVIAKECGYEEQSYFFRVFKEAMHMTASEYRSLHQGKTLKKVGTNEVIKEEIEIENKIETKQESLECLIWDEAEEQQHTAVG